MIYVMAATDAVKIGISGQPERRLIAVRCVRPCDLFFSCRTKRERRVETTAHWLLRDHHLGGEWFSVSPERAVEIVRQAMRHPIMIAHRRTWKASGLNFDNG